VPQLTEEHALPKARNNASPDATPTTPHAINAGHYYEN